MDIQEMRMLLALAKCRNFTEAAFDCAISQSSLSKHLGSLEAELGGVRLFDRSTRPVRLTDEGKLFLPYVARIVQTYDEALAQLYTLRDGPSSHLRIGTIPVMGRLGISVMLSAFRRSLPPSVDIGITDRPSKDLLPLLEARELDAAILVLPHSRDLSSGYRTYRLMSNPLCLIVSRNHRKRATFQEGNMDFSGEMVAIPDEKTGMHEVCMQLCRTRRIPKEQVQTFRNIEPILELVRERECISFLTSYMVNSYGDSDIAAIPLTPAVCSDVVLVTRSEKPTPLLRSFIAYAQKWSWQQQPSK